LTSPSSRSAAARSWQTSKGENPQNSANFPNETSARGILPGGIRASRQTGLARFRPSPVTWPFGAQVSWRRSDCCAIGGKPDYRPFGAQVSWRRSDCCAIGGKPDYRFERAFRPSRSLIPQSAANFRKLPRWKSARLRCGMARIKFRIGGCSQQQGIGVDVEAVRMARSASSSRDHRNRYSRLTPPGSFK
jgi:hypothetical protein